MGFDKTTPTDTKHYFREYFDVRAASNLKAYDGSSDDLFQSHCYRNRLEWVVSLIKTLELPAGTRILDAGCGASPLVPILNSLGYTTTGVDHSREMLNVQLLSQTAGNKLSKNLINRSYYQADLENLPFKTNTFDVIVSLGVLPYLTKDECALREMFSLLRRGGVMILCVPRKYHLGSVLDILQFAKRRIIRLAHIIYKAKENKSSNKQIEMRYYSISKFNKLLCSIGYRIELTSSMRYGPLRILGKNLFSSRINVTICRLFECMASIPGIRSLGQWHLVILRKPT